MTYFFLSWAILKIIQNIIDELEQLVQDEQRQHNLLEKAVLQLKEKGYSVDLESLKIIERFDEVERLQRYSNQIDLLQLQIQSNIVPFDPVLADTFMGRVEKLIQTPSEDLQTLEKNVTTISEHLQTRLDEMNALIRLWHSEDTLTKAVQGFFRKNCLNGNIFCLKLNNNIIAIQGL